MDPSLRRIFQDKITAYEAAIRITVYIDEGGFAHDTHARLCVHWPEMSWYASLARERLYQRDWRPALIGKLLATVDLFEAYINAASTPILNIKLHEGTQQTNAIITCRKMEVAIHSRLGVR